MGLFLHIAPDATFIDDAISFYNELGGKHRWLSIKETDSDSNATNFLYIKNPNVEPICYSALFELVSSGSYDAIIFHFLSTVLYPVVLKVPQDKKVIWSSWGADIYYGSGYFSPLIRIDLYKRKTAKEFFSDKERSFGKQIKRRIKDIIDPNRVKERNSQFRLIEKEKEQCTILQQKAISRIDLCSTVIETEYDALKSLPFFRAHYYPFRYVHKADDQTGVLHYNGDSILVGNSRDPSNNHLDILRQLTKIGIKNRIILPLSYGDPKTLDILNKEYGRDNRIVFLTDFISRQDYYKIVQQCKVAFFGHIRQQALGNINQCLKQGSKVFLYESSLVYHYYRDKGFNIFTIEKDLTIGNLEKPLSEIEISNNRKLLNDLWSYDGIMMKTREVLTSNGLIL